MKKQTLLILSSSAGAGHVRAAEALKAMAEQENLSAEVVHIDIMDIVPKFFRKLYAELYLKIIEQNPAFWGYLYHKTDKKKLNVYLNNFKLAIERLNTRKLNTLLKKINPDHIICTHFLPAELLSRKIEKGSFNVPVWVQVTDFDVHMFWIYPNMQGYFAANSEVAWRMKCRGLEEKRIYVTGIPIMPVFSKEISRHDCILELGLAPDKITVLMMSGGYGVGNIDQLIECIITLSDKLQIIALAGKNLKLYQEFKILEKKYPGKIFPQRYTRKIERLMKASDFAVTKSGGLTTSECLAMSLPMIVVSPIPGQEERNADYLLEKGAAFKACDEASLMYRVSQFIDNDKLLKKMSKNALSASTPKAAYKVLDIILNNKK